MADKNTKRRVLMLGLDAAEINLVKRWTADGSMPSLRRLCADGGLLTLNSSAAQFVGSPWPSFYMSQSPAEHGMYHFLLWRPDQQKTSRASRSWLPLKPFWRHLARTNIDVIAVDIPQAYSPRPHPGRELSGWATHEILEPPASQPPEFLEWVQSKFGDPPFDDEASHPLNITEAMAVRDQCINTTQLVGEMAETLMKTEPWDFFLMCFAAIHRAGHQLWDRSSLKGSPSDSELADFDDALRQVYIAADKSIGRLIDCVDDQTAVLVFALHGMGPNNSRTVLTSKMLHRILAGGNQRREQPGKSLIEEIRDAVPIKFRSFVKNRLPIFLQDRFTLFWRMRGIDWSQTRAFALFGDLDGYVQINLRGREKSGIVKPGLEYDQLREQIANGFKSFVDEDTGEDIVHSIEFVDESLPPGARRDQLPDIIIHWTHSSAAHHRRIVSPQFGAIDWPTPGFHPQGRSGDHARKGFLIFRGFRPIDSIENASIIDLAPTVYELLNEIPPSDFQGKSLISSQN